MSLCFRVRVTAKLEGSAGDKNQDIRRSRSSHAADLINWWIDWFDTFNAYEASVGLTESLPIHV